MKKLLTWLTFFWAFAYPMINNAQNKANDSLKTKTLSEVVITGTRTERDAASLPLPVQIISGKTIQKTGLSRLNELIQEQTGLITVPDFGGGEGVQLQGLDAAYTMILIDGQPLMGRKAGTLDLSRISVHQIERIEIIKGASSSLYGSEALAGVINIITVKTNPDEKLHGSVSYRLASFMTHDATAQLGFGRKKVSFDVLGNYYSSKGYNLGQSDFLQTVEPFWNYTLQPKINVHFSEKLHLTYSNRFYTQNQDYKAFFQAEKYSGESRLNEWNSSLVLKHKITEKLKIDYDFYLTNYKANEYLNDSQHQLFEKNDFNQWFFRSEIRSHYKIAHNTLTAGIGLNQESLIRTYFSEKAKLNSEYVFAQYEWFFSEKWNLLFGFRYDHHQQYQSQLSPKIGINYEMNPNLNLKASLGYGYKAPDLRQLFFDFTNSSVGYAVFGYEVAEKRVSQLQNLGQILFFDAIDWSKPLKPERSLGLNMGFSYQKDKLTFDVNSFYNQIEDLIDTKAIAQKTNGQNIFSYFNINRIFTYGAELSIKYQFLDNLSLSFGYQYLVAKDNSIVQEIREGKIFARDPNTLSSFLLKKEDYIGLFNRSKHTTNIKVNYEIPKWKTNAYLRFIYRSAYGIFDTNNNTILDQYDELVRGYFLVNFSINKSFKNNFSTQLGANNLFNYTDAVNISNLAGRQYFGKIQYNF